MVMLDGQQVLSSHSVPGTKCLRIVSDFPAEEAMAILHPILQGRKLKGREIK